MAKRQKTNNHLEVEDTKGVIRIRISKKNRQHTGQKTKYKETNNDLQNIHIKLKIEEHELKTGRVFLMVYLNDRKK
jgi:hypothetical protein